MSQYTVQLTNSKEGYGPVHGSENSNETLCGRDIDERFYILTNNGKGEITCKKCLREGIEK